MGLTKDLLRTETQNYTGILDRLHQPEVQARLRTALLLSIVAGRDLSQLKRHLIYGADLETVDYAEVERSLNIPPEQFARFDRTNARLIHGLLGLLTEGEELALPLFLSFFGGGKWVDKVNIIEECGDSQWYLALILDAVGSSLGQSQERVLRKLKVRFPGAFTEEDAVQRDLKAERGALGDD